MPVHIPGFEETCSRPWISKDKPPFAGEKTETDVFPMCLRLKKVHKASDWLSKENCSQDLGQLEGSPSPTVSNCPLWPISGEKDSLAIIHAWK